MSAVTARGESSVQEAPSFAEAVAEAFGPGAQTGLDPSGARAAAVRVILPTRFGVYERITLPSESHEELAAMVRLQFEKSLPYPIEETSVGFQILSQTCAAAAPCDGAPVRVLDEAERSSELVGQTTLMACGVPHAAVATLCAPLLEHQFPESITLRALEIAAQAPAGETACGLWREESDLVFGIFENRHLGFVEILAVAPEDVLGALPRVLMSAEINGAPVHFCTVLLDPTLAALAPALVSYLGAPVCDIDASQDQPSPDAVVDFTPETWRTEQTRRARFRQRRNQIATVAVLYAVALLAAFVYLVIQNSKLEALKKETFAMQPQVDAVIDRQARWKALAPAIDRRRFAVEILFQTWQSLPTAETRITQFDLAQNQIMVEGETPDAQQAIAFGEKLKANPELNDYRFEAGQPVILPNEHAQFRIFGKR